MRRVAGKQSSKMAQSLTQESYAPSIAYPYNPNASFFSKIYQMVMTKYTFSQFKSHFLDFNPQKFPDQATQIYLEGCKSFKKRDKVGILKFFTLPNYDLLKLCMKENQKTPYILDDQVVNCNLIHGSLTSVKGNSVANHNFAHLTVKLQSQNENGEMHSQYIIYERRLDADQWKIALLENIENKDRK